MAHSLGLSRPKGKNSNETGGKPENQPCLISMAMYHLTVKTISRSQGRSSVGAAAYRAGERLHNERDGETHDFTQKRGIVFKTIMLPNNAPSAFTDRETLWNAVERCENRRDSRTAREIEIALPNELSLDEQIELVRNYVLSNFISLGMCADIAIHAGKHIHNKDPRHIEAQNDDTIKQDNPHAHILLTDRPVGKDGFLSAKNPQWNCKQYVYIWREQWANVQNREFERKGLSVTVSHESYEKQGIDREPTIHQGHEVTKMERKGKRTKIGNINRAIKARNLQREKWEREVKNRIRQAIYSTGKETKEPTGTAREIDEGAAGSNKENRLVSGKIETTGQPAHQPNQDQKGIRPASGKRIRIVQRLKNITEKIRNISTAAPATAAQAKTTQEKTQIQVPAKVQTQEKSIKRIRTENRARGRKFMRKHGFSKTRDREMEITR